MLEKEVAASAAAAAATLSSVMLSWVGVDHKSLFFGFVGAFITYALRETSEHSRLKSVLFIFSSAFFGGVFGMAFGDGAQPPAAMTLYLCVVGGSGTAIILTAGTTKSAILKKIRDVLSNGGGQ
ncbi:hypothetical protein DTO96_102380 [Ephemeroptericola cinctiostellae]|uniref:Holin n=1 Tax=Ephemeroptericola cinctiostellae TaxID=2268024 RepID=A0A345DE37_9BURK|nr:hypothetical protein [Ephemeroptericola cinctiostellae]AXF86625.1 hypothetical protein DTO96_102380 [Ephemeroptericola cinctiostellae]